MKIVCKKTLILQPTNIEALTEGVEYEVVVTDYPDICVNNNQGDKHYFSESHRSEYFV